MLILLLIISAFGLLLTTILHIGSLFNIIELPQKLIMIINIGLIVVVYPTFFISSKIRNECKIQDFTKAIKDVCPRWLHTMTGLLIMYFLIGLIYSLLKRYYAGPVPLDGNRSINFHFSGWMAIYSLAFTILYSCRILKKDEKIFP